MAVIADFALETSTTTGTGTYSLAGAVSGLRTLVAGLGAGTIEYVARTASYSKWERCSGTLTDAAPDTLSRTLIESSTGSLIDWQAGDAPIYIHCIPSATRLQEIKTHHRGSSAPTGPLSAGMIWVDTTGGVTALVWKAYTAAAAWMTLWTQNESTGALTFGATITITSTDAGAAAGPTLDLYRDSASPLASDEIGEVKFSGEDSGGGTDIYARAYGVIIDPTAASEDGELRIDTSVAGTKANRLRVGAGVYTPNATGGDKGADTINAGAVYIGGALSGGMVKLTSISLSGASQADVTFDSSVYRAIVFYFDAVVMTSDGASLLARVSTDSGSSYLSTSTYSHLRVAGDTTPAVAAAGSAGDSSILIAASVDSTTSQNLSGEAKLVIGGAAANATKLEWSVGYIESTAARPTKVNGYGANSTTSQVNAVRFLPSTSTFASGSIHPYGILK